MRVGIGGPSPVRPVPVTSSLFLKACQGLPNRRTLCCVGPIRTARTIDGSPGRREKALCQCGNYLSRPQEEIFLQGVRRNLLTANRGESQILQSPRYAGPHFRIAGKMDGLRLPGRLLKKLDEASMRSGFRGAAARNPLRPIQRQKRNIQSPAPPCPARPNRECN
jgi:hypothetical protein